MLVKIASTVSTALKKVVSVEYVNSENAGSNKDEININLNN
jgi:hypothetical protein